MRDSDRDRRASLVPIVLTFQNASTRQTDSLRAQTQARHYPFAPAIGQTCTRSEPTANFFATLSKGLAKRKICDPCLHLSQWGRSDVRPTKLIGRRLCRITESFSQRASSGG